MSHNHANPNVLGPPLRRYDLEVLFSCREWHEVTAQRLERADALVEFGLLEVRKKPSRRIRAREYRLNKSGRFVVELWDRAGFEFGCTPLPTGWVR